ncbi:MAG: hypothetical protein M3082_00945 [Candidatus Dormibacteraeota bacterium]|nr:hypothetical protein [Candidatus Dormibacteraeota bacterium]
MTRYLNAAGAGFVMLTRLNVADKSAVSTPLDLPVDGYIAGLVAVATNGNVWMAWGRMLVEFDPATQKSQSWDLPSLSGVVVHPEQDGLDGNAVALVIAPDNEIWLAVHSAQAIFGFNPAAGSWDLTLQLPLVANLRTRLAVPQAGTLSANGIMMSGSSWAPVLALVQIVSRSVTLLPTHALDYTLTAKGEAVYLDDLANIGTVDLSSGATTVMAADATGASSSHLVADTTGHVWFSLLALNTVGVGNIELSSGANTSYRFPQLTASPGTRGAPPCPGPTSCESLSKATFDPGIQAITVDGRGDIWVITRLAGSGDSISVSGMSPIYELPAGS